MLVAAAPASVTLAASAGWSPCVLSGNLVAGNQAPVMVAAGQHTTRSVQQRWRASRGNAPVNRFRRSVRPNVAESAWHRTVGLRVPQQHALGATPTVALSQSADLSAGAGGAALESALTLSWSLSGAVLVPKPLAAAISVVCTTAAALGVPKPLVSSAAIQFGTSSTLDVPKPLAGVLAVVFSTASDLQVPKPLAAALTVLFAQQGDLAGPIALAAAPVVTVAQASALGVPKPLAASLALSWATTSTLTAPKPLQASLPVVVGVAPGLTVPAVLAAALGVVWQTTPNLSGRDVYGLLADLALEPALSSVAIVSAALDATPAVQAALRNQTDLAAAIAADAAAHPWLAALVSLVPQEVP